MHLAIDGPEKFRAGLYIRLSKEDDNDGQSESIGNQLSLLRDFAAQRRVEVYDTYIDDGWSGTNFDRPGFLRLIADIEAGKINMVITKDLSRLGRDYILTGHYMERYFPEHRVRYISLLDGIDTGVDSTANDITPFRAIMNDMYAKDISKKISSVKHDKQRKGLFIGGKPVYGYKMHPTEKNRIVVDEAAARVVRRVFAMTLEGLSCRQIAFRLNEDGVQTPAAYAGLPVARPGPYTGLWSGERISDMVQNEMYVGSMVQGRTKKISYKSKKCLHQRREDWIVVEGTHEPLITREIFEKARLLVGSRRHTRSRTYAYLLKGLIFCHECGYPLAVINRKNARGEDCLYFVCRTYQRSTKAGICTCHTIREETVTAAVLAKVQEFCKPSAAALLPLAEKACRSGETAARETSALKARVEALTAQMDKIYLDRLSGLLDESDFTRVYRRVKAERSALQRALSETAPFPAARADAAQDLVCRFLNGAPSNRELLVSLIERVELTKDKALLIRFRCRPPETES